jgi:hypothetical protein
MKKAFIGGMALLCMMALAMPAFAFVFVYAEIEKDKDIYVEEKVYIYKDIYLEVDVITTGDKAAEADAIANQENFDNWACENCAEKQSVITGSVLGNTGITTANQSTGNMNNQGNLVSVAVDYDPGNGTPGNGTNGGGFANAQASVDQKQGFVIIPYEDDEFDYYWSPNIVDSYNILYRDTIITDSINGNEGVTEVNQAAGNMNNQLNAAAIAVCLDGAVALSEADLGQASWGNIVLEYNTDKTALISGSVNSNTGVTFVNQTSGNMANQANNLSLSASLHP